MHTPDSPRWLLERPEEDGMHKLWDRWHDPWRLIWEGTLEECEAALEMAERVGDYP